MNISIVIPNYNGRQIIEQNLPSVVSLLASYKEGKKELIIIDDGSKDESVMYLKQFQSKNESDSLPIHILVNEQNRGFSPTVNRGVKKAAGEIVILFNTDVKPDPGCLEPLLKHFTNENVFAVGMMDKSIEKGKTVLRGRGIGKWERGFLNHGAGSLDKQNTLWVSGGSSGFRKSAWDKLGGLNELYTPFYWEDVDLGYRGQKAGYKALFEKESTVVHEHEKGAIKTSRSQFKIKSTAFRNQCFFVWLNINDTSMLLSHLFWLPYHIGRATLSGNLFIPVGFFKALIQLPFVFRSRNTTQKLFKTSDSELLLQFTT